MGIGRRGGWTDGRLGGRTVGRWGWFDFLARRAKDKHKNIAQGVGDVEMSWSDDKGTTHTYLLTNVLHFPGSPVNILSVTAFANQLDNDEATLIKTTHRHSIFKWSFGKG